MTKTTTIQKVGELPTRCSKSPEYLTLAGRNYDFGSAQARTFMILGGNIVAQSTFPHLFIINGLKRMSGHEDAAVAKGYGIKFYPKLNQDALETYRKRWTGCMGDVRRANKAGRIWINVPDENGDPVAVISFWVKAGQVDPSNLQALKDTFRITTPMIVEFSNSKGADLYQ